MIIKFAINNKRHSSIVMTPYEMEFDKFAKGLSECKKGGKFEAYFIRGGDMEITAGDPAADNPELRKDHYHRNDRSLLSADLLILDADGSIDDPKSAPDGESIHKVLVEMNITHVIYSTHSHKVNGKGNRYRVVIPCKMKTKEILWNTVNKIIDEINDAGVPLGDVTEARTWSQPWFFPTRDDPDDGLFEYYEYLEGDVYQASENEYAPNEMRGNINTKGCSSSVASHIEEKNKYRDIKEMMRTITTMGEGVHHAINGYLYGQIKDGVPKKIAEEVVRTLLNSIDDSLKDKRWEQRLAEVGRSADGAAKRVALEAEEDESEDYYTDPDTGELLAKVVGITDPEEIKGSLVGKNTNLFEMPEFPHGFMNDWPEPWPMIWENWQNFSAKVIEPLLIPTIISFHGYYLNGKYINERGRRPNMYFLNLAESTAYKDTNSKDVLRNIETTLAKNGIFNTIFTDMCNVDGNITSDTAFLKLLDSAGGKLYWINTEATRVFQMLAKSGNNSNVMALSDKMIEVVDGYAITGKAKADGSVKGIDNPNVQIIFYAQPETIEEYITPEMVDSGFMGRSIITLDVGLEDDYNIFGTMEDAYCEMDYDLMMFYSQNRIDNISGRVECPLVGSNLKSAIKFEHDVLRPIINKKSEVVGKTGNVGIDTKIVAKAMADTKPNRNGNPLGGMSEIKLGERILKDVDVTQTQLRKLITRMGNTAEQLFSVVYGVCREWDIFSGKSKVRELEDVEFESLVPILEYWAKVKAYGINEFIDFDPDIIAVEIEDVFYKVLTGELRIKDKYEEKLEEGKIPRSEIVNIVRSRRKLAKKLGLSAAQMTSIVNGTINALLSAGIFNECYEVGPNSNKRSRRVKYLYIPI